MRHIWGIECGLKSGVMLFAAEILIPSENYYVYNQLLSKKRKNEIKSGTKTSH